MKTKFTKGMNPTIITKDLNESCTTLLKKYLEVQNLGSLEYFKKVDEIIKPEWLRIYTEDMELKSINSKSIKILLRLNLSHKFVPLYLFGLFIDIGQAPEMPG